MSVRQLTLGHVPRVLDHRGRRVGGGSLEATPRGEEDGVGHLNGCDARALVVREGEDVVAPAVSPPVRVVRLDPSQRLAVVIVAAHGRGQPVVGQPEEEVVDGGRSEEARDVAAAVDGQKEAVGGLGVEGAVRRGEQQLVHRHLQPVH
eukprot:6704897-Prymnesium_polylepis.1